MQMLFIFTQLLKLEQNQQGKYNVDECTRICDKESLICISCHETKYSAGGCSRQKHRYQRQNESQWGVQWNKDSQNGEPDDWEDAITQNTGHCCQCYMILLCVAHQTDQKVHDDYGNDRQAIDISKLCLIPGQKQARS